jgi:protein-tyrosine phosphatase
MAAIGCVVQVTASSFTGFWGSGPKKISEWLLKKGAVHVLASDGHDPERRKPILSEGRDAVAAIAGEAVANLLVSENPQAIVDGRNLT